MNNNNNLTPIDTEDLEDDLLPEYDEATLRTLLKNGVRGKYVDRYRQGTNLNQEPRRKRTRYETATFGFLQTSQGTGNLPVTD